MKKILFSFLNVFKKLWLIRKLNINFSGEKITHCLIFTAHEVNVDTFVFVFSNKKALWLETEKNSEKFQTNLFKTELSFHHQFEQTINGFSFLDYIFKNKISFLNKEGNQRIFFLKRIAEFPSMNTLS